MMVWRNDVMGFVCERGGGRAGRATPVVMAAMLAITGSCGISSMEDDPAVGEVRQAVGTPGGFVVVSGDDADDGGHCQGTACGGIYPVFLAHAVSDSLSPGSGILALGVNGGQALVSLNSWNNPANGGPGAVITHVTSISGIASANFASFKAIYLPSYEGQTSGGMTNAQITAVKARQADFADFVNNKGGSLVALTQAGSIDAWGFLPAPLITVDASTTNVSRTAELTAIAPLATDTNLDHCCYHNVFTGPPGFNGLKILATRQEDPLRGIPVLLGGRNVILTAEICNDGLDNDGDGQIDRADPDCLICGDGFLDPGEECDDGNTRNGDGCSGVCTLENSAPNAVCEDRTTCNDPAVCSAQVVGLGAGSTDPDGDALTITQSPPGPYSVGHHHVSVSVSDGVEQDQCVADVDVLDCENPNITCPSAFRLECTGNGQATVSPPSATATDNCNVATVSGPSSGSLPLGTSTLSYTAVDDADNSASCTTAVQVVDTIPPQIACPPAVAAECTGNGQAVVDPGHAVGTDICQLAEVRSPGPSSFPLGTTGVTHTAVDSSGNQASCVNAVTVLDTLPPNILCPAPVVAECTGSKQAIVDPGTALASDICTSATVSSPGAGSFPLGTTTVSHSAVDASGNQASCSGSVTVQDTTPPAISCPAPVVVECQANSSAFVAPPSATATDICTAVSVNGAPAGQYPLGTTVVTQTATDEVGNTNSCQSTVQVVDTTPPDVSVTPPQPLWPPNHKYRTISLADCAVSVVDQCGGGLDPNSVSARIKCVSSDEPENDLGDGNTGADIVFVNATTVMLRSERQGTRDGRVYNITFEVRDASGNTQQAVCPVSVPHDQGKGDTAIDSGAVYTVCN